MGCQKSTPIPLDKARLSGKYANEISLALKDSVNNVRIVACTNFRDLYERQISLNEDGTFVFDVPLVCPTQCVIFLEGYTTIVYLTPGEETQFEVTVSANHKRKLTMIKGIGFTEEEYLTSRNVFSDVVSAVEQNWFIDPEMQPEEKNRHILNNLKELDKKIEESMEISYDVKQSLKREMAWYYLLDFAFNFNEYRVYDDTIERQVKKVSDFSFLKYFNLNDSTIFHERNYGFVFQKILADEILNIPAIEELSVGNWLKKVKPIMADLIGSDTGLFYDLLAANAYYRQLSNDLKPLSEKQIENMKAYFWNETYVDLLLEINEKAVEITNVKKNETPAVPKEKLMEAIISQYKGQVVVVDFWATWCQPCLLAMDESQNMKNAMKDKNVVFVYITNTTSDIKKFYETSHEVGGEHYILKSEEWHYIQNHFGFNGIPTYMIYSANGVLKHKITGYPGNDNMRKMIEDLLP
jgi:thiol-disulfide isomerase/thioredoxin